MATEREIAIARKIQNTNSELNNLLQQAKKHHLQVAMEYKLTDDDSIKEIRFTVKTNEVLA